jgi:hypothetical protein
MASYAPLPAYQNPANAMVNFQPVSDALDSYQKGMVVAGESTAKINAANAMAAGDSKTAMAELMKVNPEAALKTGLFDLNRQGKEQEVEKNYRALIGSHAQTLSEVKDPTERAALLDKWVNTDAKVARGLQKMGIDHRANPDFAIKSIYQDALGAQDPEQQKLIEAQTGKANREQIEPGNRVVSFDPSQPQGRTVVQGDLSMKTPGERAQVAKNMGLTEGSPDYQAIVINGKLPDVVPDHKAIQEADTKVLNTKHLINDLGAALATSKTFSGGIAADAAPILNKFGGTENSRAVKEFDNMVQNSILPNLKSTFGARVTNVDVLLMKDLAGAASQPQSVREGILNRAIARAREVQAEQDSAARQLRNRDYYKQGGGPQAPGTVRNGPAAGPAVAKPNTDQLPPQIQSDADYQALPAGAQYRDPEGNIRTKR